MRLTGREPVRVGAVVVDVGPDQHKALQHTEGKVRTYGKALLVLAGLLCLSVCGNLVCSALSILIFKEARFSDAIPPPLPRSVVLSDSKAAAPVGTGLPTYVNDTPADPESPVVATAPADDTVPLVVSPASVPAAPTATSPASVCCWRFNGQTKRYQFYLRPANAVCQVPYTHADCPGGSGGT